MENHPLHPRSPGLSLLMRGSSVKYIGAIDQGTTSTRFILFDAQGRIISQAQREHTQIYPKAGWVEQDPLEIWENTQKLLVDAFAQSGITPSQVLGLGITNQRETVVLWNRKTGKPVYNALVWQDVRTADFCHSLEQNFGKMLVEKTGLPPATYFSASKIHWVLENIPGTMDLAQKGDLLFGTVDTWLLWNLTGGVDQGVHKTDVTNASRTQLMNLRTLEWDPQLLKLFSIPEEILPKICPTSGLFGTALVLGHPIPVGALMGDQQAALFGQTCFEPGEAKNTYGTGCFLLLNTGKVIHQSKNGLLTTLAYQLTGEPPIYALEGSVAVAGALVQWLRDNMGFFHESAQVEELATGVEDNGGVYLVPAFSGLFAPHWRPDARGAILGLTRFAHKGHIARAALESTAFQTLDVLEAMSLDAGERLKILKVDGGMTVNHLLMQFQADILGIQVVRPLVRETTALGAAYAAGLALGMWKNLGELKKLWKYDQDWIPKMSQDHRSTHLKNWKKALEKSLGWVDVGVVP